MTDKSVDTALAELVRPEVRDADFDALFDESPSGIVLIHADGTILRANASFCSLLGYGEAELVRRRKTYDITHPDDVEPERIESAKILTGESHGFQLTKRFLTKRGHAVWVTSYIAPVRDQKAVFIHFVGHTTALPLSEDFYRIETSAAGDTSIRPFYPLAKLVRDNWKAVSLAATTVLGSLGGLSVNYLTMRSETTQQKETIVFQQKEIERQKAELEDMRRRVDRIDRK